MVVKVGGAAIGASVGRSTGFEIVVMTAGTPPLSARQKYVVPGLSPVTST